MRAGQLDRLIDIQHETTVVDEYGQEDKTWVDLATDVPANVLTESPRERIRANRLTAALAHIITIRYRGDVTSEMRIVYEGKTLRITGPPREIDRRAFLEITALYES